MLNRLRALPWGWIIIALCYGMAVLPIYPQQRLFWLGLAVAAAYCVLARRTTIQTAKIAQSSDDQSILALWRQAISVTLVYRALLVLPTFALMMAAKDFMTLTSYMCPGVFRAYCMTYGGGVEPAPVALALMGLGVFLLLDHGLLVALALFARKYIVSNHAVSNAALGIRFAIACAIVSVVMVFTSLVDLTSQGSFYPYSSGSTVTEWRVAETIYPAFEPLATNGIFLGANMMNHPAYCINYDNNARCISLYDTRPFIARQMLVAALGAMLYGLLIVGVLRLTAPFNLRLSLTEKAKRGTVDQEADIAYL